MSNHTTKLPRLYINLPLQIHGDIELNEDQTHYLRNVLRRINGDLIRFFNGRDGEFTGEIKDITKNQITCTITEKIKEQPPKKRDVHLFFAPVKKHRLDFLIEKSVELGVTHLHPVLTQNTENRVLKIFRIQKQIIESSEQCERMNIAQIEQPKNLMTMLHGFKDIKLYAALERSEAKDIADIDLKAQGDIGFIVGPEGGFSKEERQWIQEFEGMTPISLGTNILRAETACLKLLANL